jgi:hypothetical protein
MTEYKIHGITSKPRNTMIKLPNIIARPREHHKAANHEKAAHHARIAFGHYLEAAEHQNNAARQHAKEHS